jgi:hypothetical protein
MFSEHFFEMYCIIFIFSNIKFHVSSSSIPLFSNQKIYKTGYNSTVMNTVPLFADEARSQVIEAKVTDLLPADEALESLAAINYRAMFAPELVRGKVHGDRFDAAWNVGFFTQSVYVVGAYQGEPTQARVLVAHVPTLMSDPGFVKAAKTVVNGFSLPQGEFDRLCDLADGYNVFSMPLKDVRSLYSGIWMLANKEPEQKQDSWVMNTLTHQVGNPESGASVMTFKNHPLLLPCLGAGETYSQKYLDQIIARSMPDPMIGIYHASTQHGEKGKILPFGWFVLLGHSYENVHVAKSSKDVYRFIGIPKDM